MRIRVEPVRHRLAPRPRRPHADRGAGRRRAPPPDGDPGERRRPRQRRGDDAPEPRRRPRGPRRGRSPRGGGRTERARGDVIDLETFRRAAADDGDGGRPSDYDSGLQIFLMGFAEAGRTAVQLAADAVNPFRSEEEGEGDDGWWYDEARGRRVLDREVLHYSPAPPEDDGGGDAWYDTMPRGRSAEEDAFDYSPPAPRPRRRRAAGGGRQGESRRPPVAARDVGDGERPRQATNPDNNGDGQSTRTVSSFQQADQEDVPLERVWSETADNANHTAATVEEREKPLTVAANDISNGPAPCDDTSWQRRGRTRRFDNEDGTDENSRPIYGLYRGTRAYDDDVRDEQGTAEEADADGPHREEVGRRRERHWKDRVRRKFDAALGLQSPSSAAADEGAYYASWKSKMVDLDRARTGGGAPRGRRRRRSPREETDERATSLESWNAPPSPPPPPSTRRHRRARTEGGAKGSEDMRGRAPRPRPLPPAGGSPLPLVDDADYDSRGSVHSRKSPWEEVPFWREGSSLASLLFNTRLPSGARDGGRGTRRESLEVGVS